MQRDRKDDDLFSTQFKKHLKLLARLANVFWEIERIFNTAEVSPANLESLIRICDHFINRLSNPERRVGLVVDHIPPAENIFVYTYDKTEWKRNGAQLPVNRHLFNERITAFRELIEAQSSDPMVLKMKNVYLERQKKFYEYLHQDLLSKLHSRGAPTSSQPMTKGAPSAPPGSNASSIPVDLNDLIELLQTFHPMIAGSSKEIAEKIHERIQKHIQENNRSTDLLALELVCDIFVGRYVLAADDYFMYEHVPFIDKISLACMDHHKKLLPNRFVEPVATPVVRLMVPGESLSLPLSGELSRTQPITFQNPRDDGNPLNDPALTTYSQRVPRENGVIATPSQATILVPPPVLPVVKKAEQPSQASQLFFSQSNSSFVPDQQQPSLPGVQKIDPPSAVSQPVSQPNPSKKQKKLNANARVFTFEPESTTGPQTQPHVQQNRSGSAFNPVGRSGVQPDQKPHGGGRGNRPTGL